MKKISFLLIASLFFGLATVTSSAAPIEDEQWLTPQIQTTSYHGISIQNTGSSDSTFSDLLAGFFNRDSNPNNFDRYVCTSTSQPDCVGADNYEYNAILPICTTTDQSDCVDSLSALNPDGRVASGVFSKYTIDHHPNNFAPDPKLGIPDNANPGIWNIQGAPHQFGTEYVVRVSLSGYAFQNGPGTQSLSADITPVSELAGGADSQQAKCETWLDPVRNHYNNRCHNYVTPSDAKYKCAFALGDYLNGPASCLLPHAFPANTKFSLSVRLKHEPVTWFHGRMDGPEIGVDQLSSGVRLRVTALPIKVPVAFYGDLWNNLPKPVTDFWNKCETQASQDFKCAGAGINSDPLPVRTGTMLLAPFGTSALEAIQALSDVTGNKATVSPQVWTFNTLASNNSTSSCFTSGTGVKGIVTTNSTAYSEGPPSFDGTSLNYKVASLHYNPDGSVFRGSYNLVVRSDVARCLYKFTNAPIQASISVVSADGSNNVATTVANEKNGWLYLSANGFTFSSPTIQVKLSQEAPAPTPTASPAPVASESPTPTPVATKAPVVAKKTTITCVKGKISKSVTGLKPVCPTGYKKR